MSLRTSAYRFCPWFLRPALDRVAVSAVGRRLARGVFWSVAGAVISRGLMLAASVLVARILGKTGYGEFGMIQSTVGMFGVFAGFGLGLTATKHVAEFRKTDPERAGRIIRLSAMFAGGTGGLMALALVVFAPYLAARTINAPHLSGVLRIGGLILLLSAVNGAQTGALSGLEAFKAIARVNLLAGLASFPLMVCGAWWGRLTGAVWASVLCLALNCLLNRAALLREADRQHVPLNAADCGREARVLWTFSLPAVISGAMVGPVNWVCRALLVNRPDGYAEMGVLSVTMVFQGVLLFVSGMLNAPLLSMISNEGPKAEHGVGVVNILSSWGLGVVAAIPLLCFPEVIEAAFGSEYRGHGFRVTLALVAFSTAIMTFKAGLARALAAGNLLWWGVMSNALWAAILIVATKLLVGWGARGVAAATAIAYAVNTIVLVPLYRAKGLVPAGTLVSVESTLVWGMLCVLVLFNVLDVSLLLRAVAFLPCLVLAGLAFNRMARLPALATACVTA